MAREKYNSKLNDISTQITALGEAAAVAIEKSLKALKEKNDQQAQNIINADENINHQRFIVEERLVSLIAKEQPVASDLRLIVAHLVVTTELERIGDYAANNSKSILKLEQIPPAPLMTEFQNMGQSVVDMLRQSLQAYSNGDTAMAVIVGNIDDVVDNQYDQVYMAILQAAGSGTISMADAMHLLWIAHNLERSADRATNVCERVIYAKTGLMKEFEHGIQGFTHQA